MTGRAYIATNPDAADELVAYFDAEVKAGRVKRWPRFAVLDFLTRAQDLACRPVKPERFPGRREIAKRVGWTEDEVRGLLRREDLWADDAKAEVWAKTHPSKRAPGADSPAPPPPVPRASPAPPPAETVETAEPADDSPAVPPQVPRGSPAEPHRRVGVTMVTTVTTVTPPSEEEHKDAPEPKAKTRKPSGANLDTLAVWTEYRDLQFNRGTRRQDSPVSGWGVTDRVAEYGRDRMIGLVRWAHLSNHHRADFLRKTDCLGKTLFRPSNAADYVVLADAWTAAGERDAPSAPVEARGRDRPRVDHAAVDAEALAILRRNQPAPPLALALEPSDADPRSDLRSMDDVPPWATHPAARAR